MRINLGRLRALRLAVGLTKKELSDVIGCIENTISRWENGATKKPLGIYRKELEKFFRKHAHVLNPDNPK
ncbi:unnamed protein product [marine sediment metagenome]|uniref:HTH cro/C1-type domain-containing protein n=1 Tax=marine sediment metagenome TaxID=412755 RepID=X1LWB8_9ZZZZ